MISLYISKKLIYIRSNIFTKKFSSGPAHLRLLKSDGLYYKARLGFGIENSKFRTIGFGDRVYLHESQKFKYFPLVGDVSSNNSMCINYRSSFLLAGRFLGNTSKIDLNKKNKSFNDLSETLRLWRLLLSTKSSIKSSYPYKLNKIQKNGVFFQSNSFLKEGLFVPNRRKNNFHSHGQGLTKRLQNKKIKISEIKGLTLETPEFFTNLFLNIFRVRLKFIRRSRRFNNKNQKFTFFIRFNKLGSQFLYKKFFLKNLYLLRFNIIKNCKNNQYFNSRIFSLKTKKLARNFY